MHRLPAARLRPHPSRELTPSPLFRPAREPTGCDGEARLGGDRRSEGKSYRGAGSHVRVPFEGVGSSEGSGGGNSTHAEIRRAGEQPMDVMKGCRLLRNLRCSIHRITDMVKAIVVAHRTSPS